MPQVITLYQIHRAQKSSAAVKLKEFNINLVKPIINTWRRIVFELKKYFISKTINEKT